MNKHLDALVIAPHPDDAEIGMGGAIVKMLAAGKQVGILDLTNGEPTPFGTPEIRAKETDRASAVLGVKWRRNLGLPNRRLEATLENRALLAGVIRETRPAHLFAPYWVDAHPDHVAALELIEAARFWAKLTKSDLPFEPYHPKRVYNYFCVHLNLAIQPAFILDISDVWQTKRKSLECYESQFILGKADRIPSFLDQREIQASYWGQLIGVRYGEPFACREPIGLTELSSLI